MRVLDHLPEEHIRLCVQVLRQQLDQAFELDLERSFRHVRHCRPPTTSRR